MAWVNLLDTIIYPTGTYYMSTGSDSPAATLGGVWNQLDTSKTGALKMWIKGTGAPTTDETIPYVPTKSAWDSIYKSTPLWQCDNIAAERGEGYLNEERPCDLSLYRYILIEYVSEYTGDRYQNIYTKIFKPTVSASGYLSTIVINGDDRMWASVRRINLIGDSLSSIRFYVLKGYWMYINDSSSVCDNRDCVPIAIYGLK